MSLSTLRPTWTRHRAVMGPSLGIRFDQTDTILKSKKLARVWRHSAHCASLPEKKIFVYSKDDCPLCDGLKQKLSAILDRAPFTGSLLKDYSIEVRDILTNRSWEEKYSMHIPVMAIEHSDGQEVRCCYRGNR